VRSHPSTWLESVEKDCKGMEANEEIHLNGLPNACGANFQFMVGIIQFRGIKFMVRVT